MSVLSHVCFVAFAVAILRDRYVIACAAAAGMAFAQIDEYKLYVNNAEKARLMIGPPIGDLNQSSHVQFMNYKTGLNWGKYYELKDKEDTEYRRRLVGYQTEATSQDLQ